MHSLGVEHEEVGNVVRGIDEEIARFWDELGNATHCVHVYKGKREQRVRMAVLKLLVLVRGWIAV